MTIIEKYHPLFLTNIVDNLISIFPDCYYCHIFFGLLLVCSLCQTQMFFLLTTSHVWVTGGVATECEGKDGVNLTCKFLEDINSTQTDFSVYFDPDNGSQGN